MTHPHAASQAPLCAPTDSGPHLDYAIDTLRVEPGVILVAGWCAVNGKPARSLYLTATYANGDAQRITVEYGTSRPDVAETVKGTDSNCGFYTYRALSNSGRPTSVHLHVNEMEARALVLPYAVGTKSAPPGGLAPLRYHLKRFVFHLRKGNWSLLAERLRRQLPSLFARKLKPNAFSTEFSALKDDTVLVVDHNLGGGANHYRTEVINRYLAESRQVLLWTFSPATLTFELHIHTNRRPRRTLAVPRAAIKALAESGKISEVIYNNCVSFPEPERVPDELLAFTSRADTTLTLLVHDYFMICPSHFLLDDTRRYCTLPAMSRCETCLPKVDDGLASLFRAKDIHLWRAHWLAALRSAHRIICFSQNSRQLLLKAYPEMQNRMPNVVPHSVAYMDGTYAYPRAGTPFTVAMVGDISYHKGSEVLKELARASEAHGIELRIVIIGTLVAAEKPNGIIETGTYKRNELPKLIKQHEVHMAMMLSILPETFSYVTHELIQLGVPVLSFDIGAQGEAVGNYINGMTIPCSDGENVLNAAMAFKTTLDSRYFNKVCSTDPT